MQCYACQRMNADNARYCVECGATLALAGVTYPTPIEPAFAPAPYAPSDATPRVVGAPLAPGAYQPGARIQPPAAYPAAAPGTAPAGVPYGYVLVPAVPAPGAGASLVNNVTVTQSPPPTAASPAPSVAGRHVDGLGLLVRAVYFVGSGVVLGGLWDEAIRASGDGHSEAVPLVLVVTVLIVALDVVILERLAHR